MARQITQTLKNLPIISSSSYSRTLCLFSNKPQLIEIDLTQSNPNPDLSAGIQHLEDAIHTIIVRRLQPDWLPFRPGSSFWAPPRKSVATNLLNLAARNNNNNTTPINYPLSNEESLSLVSGHGWPSSNYFLTHLDSPPGVEVNIFSHNLEDASESEDDDNDV